MHENKSKPKQRSYVLSRLALGTHQLPWDLGELLYGGATSDDRGSAYEKMYLGAYGPPVETRRTLVDKLFEGYTTRTLSGESQKTIVASLTRLRYLFEWCEKSQIEISLSNIEDMYFAYCESLWRRFNINNDLDQTTAYGYALSLGATVARVLDIKAKGRHSAAPLIRRTRIRKPRSIVNQGEKQKIDVLPRFGEMLDRLCEGLTSEAIRGALPLEIEVIEGTTRIFASRLKGAGGDSKAATIKERRDYEKRRQPLANDATIFNDFVRAPLANLRIEAEYQLFLAETGLNPGVTLSLIRKNFRLQSIDDELVAHEVYKERRSGNVVFTTARTYRKQLSDYIKWIKDVGLNSDERLFPFISIGRLPAVGSNRDCRATRGLCKELGIPYVSPKMLRSTRENWMIRKGAREELAADMHGHSVPVMRKHYAEPSHQKASAEISSLYAAKAAGPGECLRGGGSPIPLDDLPESAPKPDCVSPDGCFFCKFHKDIHDEDYVWLLASHRKLKLIESDHYKPPIKMGSVHPAKTVVDRITEKLSAFKSEGPVAIGWVDLARNKLRAGVYHPYVNGFIRLAEATIV